MLKLITMPQGPLMLKVRAFYWNTLVAMGEGRTYFFRFKRLKFGRLLLWERFPPPQPQSPDQDAGVGTWALEAQVQELLITEGSHSIGRRNFRVRRPGAGCGFSSDTREADQKRDKSAWYKFGMSQHATEYHG